MTLFFPFAYKYNSTCFCSFVFFLIFLIHLFLLAEEGEHVPATTCQLLFLAVIANYSFRILFRPEIFLRARKIKLGEKCCNQEKRLGAFPKRSGFPSLIDGDLLIDVVGRRGAMRLSCLLSTCPFDLSLFSVRYSAHIHISQRTRWETRNNETICVISRHGV